MLKILIIYHGQKWTLKDVSIWKQQLSSTDLAPEFVATKHKGHATELAVSCTHNVVMAVGGDGLISECINGIMALATKPLFCFHPKGTGNDYHRSVSGIRSPKDLIDALTNKKIVQVDLLKISGNKQTRYCNNVTDIGLGGLVVFKLEELRKSQVRFSYFKAIVKAFKEYIPKELNLLIDDQPLKCFPLLIAFAKGNYFGNKIGIAPHANVSDKQIAITLIDRVSVMTYLRFLPKLKQQKKINDPRIKYLKGSQVKIMNSSLNMEVDGEGFEPGEDVTISVIEEAISVVTL